METREGYGTGLSLDKGAVRDTLGASSEIRSILPEVWREYLMKRRQALLMEVSEIERILDLLPSRMRRSSE